MEAVITPASALAVTPGEPASALWERVAEKLKARHGEAVYRSWLRGLECKHIEGGKAVLTAPTRFMREWVAAHYGADIRAALQELRSDILAIDILVRQADAPAAAPCAPSLAVSTSPAADAALLAVPEADLAALAMSAPLDPRCTFEHFVVGKPNELAHAAARRVAESPAVVPGCNPLFLYGGVGLGKTHLMHAIAWHIRAHGGGRRVIYLSAEKFMYQFIKALRSRESLAFKETFRSVDVLMIDDVQFISGKDSTQEEFFHTFNALVDQNKQLVISGDRSPSDLEGIEERVRSRLGWGLVADIHATTYELRLGILHSKIEQMRGIHIPQKVVEFLAHKITSNVRELEGALNRVVAHATLVGRAITIETAQEVLMDLLRAHDKRVTVEDIQKKVAEHYHIKVSDMHSARRSRSVARPRQVAMFLAKRLTTRSLPDIGRRFGGKDHTTVIHAVKKVEELISQDAEFASEVELLERMMRA
ncbi:MAG: chromosomal replication initiator protein DnaA [Alphaproteobacteria bacterium]|nr:chromosomal replication initiator protein DnaA [Alphaproteobacteria bacterium]